ncbi:FliF [Desulfamplus magnetovallimortis]|uniref:Flagellar M-ring protein n=1 Tax=Desulfamplus magnetovallimortis TaxID=1246637 RepID=A0A1W1H9W4_9BACT|nr:flagellar basal-body MS-ring/collar protein FliF [Desulfamplus magnetovallimortis]SLM29261.1 FliF [Desulfamplus magnetovallimortis]
MNPFFEQVVKLFREMSLYKKIALGMVVVLMIAGFTTMFIWANKTEFKVAYTELEEEDASLIVEKLKESKTPYKLQNGGKTILVPDAQVYDVRLTMASQGIPKGSGVGYEIFDQTDFGTTEFVQKINRLRAIQGELARTIRSFEEVKDAKVMIVLPKDSVFVEETKKPSASIMLELKSDIDDEKVAAVAHLVASAIEDLTPDLVTIVDTAGRILFEATTMAEKKKQKEQENIQNLAQNQYEYKDRYEQDLAKRIETMLERIVGKDKAIVRVVSEMDFSTNSVSEEIYDPLQLNNSFIRSKKALSESGRKNIQNDGTPSSVNPIVPEDDPNGNASVEQLSKSSETVNYELSRRTSETVKPMALIKRVSVAAVIDGKYEYKTDDTGNRTRTYVPRSDEEMQQFQQIVAKAMGYNEEREDQVTIESLPFASIAEMGDVEPELKGWRMIQKEYGRTIANILLILLLFLFVIRPIIKTAKDIQTSVEQAALPQPDDKDLLEEPPEEEELSFIEMDPQQQKDLLETMTPEERDAFIAALPSSERAVYYSTIKISEKASYLAKEDIERSANIIKGWLKEVQEKEEDKD